MKGTNSNTFMDKYSLLVCACILAVALGGYATYRVTDQKKKFDKTVKETLQVSEGYDHQFIEMVNRLEDELAERASFGYAGRKDPMTGHTRVVATPVRPVARRIAVSGGPVTVPAAVHAESAEIKQAEVKDPVRLTAIIYDNTKRIYTAVVMDGDRSFSVEVGDRIAGRKITRITNEEIYMENADERFIYNILGGNTRVQK